MIYDKLENLKRYKGLYGNLDIAIDVLCNIDITKLNKGKTVIQEGNIYINRITGMLVNANDGEYEYHRHHLDIHIDISGCENVLFCDVDKTIEDYNEDGDYALVQGSEISNCLIDNKHFVICMLEEAHMPCVTYGNAKTTDKIIVKVKCA